MCGNIKYYLIVDEFSQRQWGGRRLEILADLEDDKPEVWNSLSMHGDSVHEMGIARIGRDYKASVLNPWNRMWKAKNIFVTDGSAMISSACQNPSLTYMAMAARVFIKAVAIFKKETSVLQAIDL